MGDSRLFSHWTEFECFVYTQTTSYNQYTGSSNLLHTASVPHKHTTSKCMVHVIQKVIDITWQVQQLSKCHIRKKYTYTNYPVFY